ncbi:MAG: UDP-N-acetylglucosamine 2-epimerase, partial [Parcubacteria group bacterium]|nr:UDP-N-acetylglucosamine 2-epimerase [Parcubacteria group bacterium]
MKRVKTAKIAYISGTRADFGLMTPILRAIERSPALTLQLSVTGIHLMPEFGETANEVLREFPGTKKIPAVFLSDERKGMADFTGQFLQKAVAAFEKDRPDFVL